MPNDKIVQLPSGEKVQFPASMADADINTEITKYLGSKQTGAMQSKRGGPVFNASLTQPPAADESTLAKVGRGAALGAAGGAGIAETPTPVRDTLKNLFSSWVNPSDPEATARNAPPVAMASGLVQGFGKATDAINPIIDNFFRMLSNKTGGRQFDYKPVDPEQTAHDITSFGTQLAMLKGGKEATAEGITAVPDVRRGVQEFLNVGPNKTAEAVAQRSGEAAEIEQANRQSLARSRAEHEATVGEIERQNQAARESTSAKNQAKAQAVTEANRASKESFAQRQQLLTEAQGHAKELAAHLPQLAEQDRAFAKSLYPEVEGTADPKELYGRLGSALDKLQGSEKVPTSLSKVMKELEPSETKRTTGPQVGGRFLDLNNPNDFQAFQQFKAKGVFTPAEIERMEGGGVSEAPTFEKVHGWYSELGRDLGRDMPGDERAAIMEARTQLESTMRKMAERENKLSQFAGAQRYWKQYENTFNKTWNDDRGVASPIAKALRMADPTTGQLLPERISSFLSKDNNYALAQKLLSKFGKGAKTDVLQLMKEKIDQAGTLPKSLKEKPLPAEEIAKQKALPTSQSISLKEAPGPIDPRQLKADALRQGAESWRKMRFGDIPAVIAGVMGHPTAFAYPIGHRLVGRAMQSPRFIDWASRPTPEEMQMVKPSQVFPSKAAAMKAVKGGPKGGINAGGYEASLKPIEKSRMIDSLSNEIDTMKGKLRNATDASLADKAALAKQISDYQQRLDELRGDD